MPCSFLKAAPGRPGRTCLATSALILSLLGTACGGGNADAPADEAAAIDTNAVDTTAGEPIDVVVSAADDSAAPAEGAASTPAAGEPVADYAARAFVQAVSAR